MSKVLVVARSELVRTIFSKAFLIPLLLLPMIWTGAFFLDRLADSMRDVDDRRFAVVDATGELPGGSHGGLYGDIARAAEARNAAGIQDPDDPAVQVEPRFVPEPVDDPERASGLELADRVRAGELSGYLVIEPGEAGDDAHLTWFTDTPSYDDLPDWLGAVVTAALQERRAGALGLERGVVERVMRRAPVRAKLLPEAGEGGEVVEGRESNKFADVILPLLLGFLMYMMVFMSAPALMNSVLEVKINKISEVIVSSVTSFQFFLGRLLASIGATLLLSSLYLGTGILLVQNVDAIPPSALEALSPKLVGSFVVFLVLALLIYGSIFSALGAACTELQDAQTIAWPAAVLLVIPMLLLDPVLEDPDGTVARAISFFPPATPMVMLLRVALPPGVALWELAAAAILTAAFAALCVAAGGRIFRIGILAQGQTPSYRRLLSWVLAR